MFRVLQKLYTGVERVIQKVRESYYVISICIFKIQNDWELRRYGILRKVTILNFDEYWGRQFIFQNLKDKLKIIRTFGANK